eukprot:gene4682-3357_t
METFCHHHPQTSFLPFIPTSSFVTQERTSFNNEGMDPDNDSQSFDGEEAALQAFLSSALLPVKKRRQRPSRGKAFPRIIKHDIRRYYGQMFVNAMNSHNGPTIDAFLERYTLPQVTMRKRVSRSHPFVLQGSDVASPTMEIAVEGRANISRYWQLLQSLVPDQVLRINSVRIARNVRSEADPTTGNVRFVSNATARVICEWEGRATQVYEGCPPCLFAYSVLQGNATELMPTDDECSCSTSSWSSESTSLRTARVEDSYAPRRQPPGLLMFPLKQWPITFAFNLRGRLVLEVDGDLRLKSIDFGTAELFT